MIMPGLADAQVSGRIIDVNWPSYGKMAGGGYSAHPVITIENTGSEAHVFYVQVGTQDPTGKWDDEFAMSTDTIAPGKKIKFSDILITIDPFYDNKPRGNYNGRVILYADSFKNHRLDSQIQNNAFKV